MLNNKKIPKESLIFLHIPKTGGMTLDKIIERQYSSEKIFTIDGWKANESLAEFQQMSEKSRQEIKVVKGHLYFGIHDLLPQPAVYITMLRNPIERLISHYYYVLRNPSHYLFSQVKDQNMTFKDYVSSGISTELNNGQTRLLSGQNPSYGSCHSSMLSIAKKNLTTIVVFGLTEKFDESLILFQKKLGWKAPLYIPYNVSKNKKSEPLESETVEIITEFNLLDIELYDFAKSKFEEEVSQWSTDLKKFQLENKVYQAKSQVQKKARKVANFLIGN